jgi:hypothetical protein
LFFHFLLENLLYALLADHEHQEVKVLLGTLVRSRIKQDLRLDVDSAAFAREKTLNLLKHLQNLEWVHTAIIIVIAQFKHH